MLQFPAMPAPRIASHTERGKHRAAKEPEAQLAGFLSKYTPEIETLTKVLRAKMRARFPGATELVYDNYNALVIGYSPSERASEAVFSLVSYPRYVSFFFLQARGLVDPERLLQGSGTVARHVVLHRPEDLESPAMENLIQQALELAKVPLQPNASPSLVIKSVSAKQRPRRPPT